MENSKIKRRWTIANVGGVGVVTQQPAGITPKTFAVAMIETAASAR